MRRYKFLQHTADAKFQAFGTTIEEAFANAALATASLMWDWGKVSKRRQYPVKIEARDLKQLLVNFLEEIIYLLDSKMFLLASAEKIRIEKKENRFFLKALFRGDKYSDKYKIYRDVKAVTYNEMEIANNDHFTIQAVVDI